MKMRIGTQIRTSIFAIKQPRQSGQQQANDDIGNWHNGDIGYN
ncbi:hypothetical protein [Bacillus sp. MUM 116]|nr:hypothetical protein [Bacillus sp. MUM 116]